MTMLYKLENSLYLPYMPWKSVNNLNLEWALTNQQGKHFYPNIKTGKRHELTICINANGQ